MTNYEYYDGTPPHNDTDTSISAACQLDLNRANSLRNKIYAIIQHSVQGKTCDEVEQILCSPHTSVSARIRELVLDKRIEDSGLRRKTQYDRNARVYKAVVVK